MKTEEIKKETFTYYQFVNDRTNGIIGKLRISNDVLEHNNILKEESMGLSIEKLIPYEFIYWIEANL